MRVRAHRVLFGVLCCVVGFGCVGVALPVAAGAFATVAPPPLFSSMPGLPDGRVYELVTPADKHGYGVEVEGAEVVANASAEGDAILFKGEGPLAEASTNGNEFALFVSQRSPTGGWVTRSATPRGAVGVHEPEENNSLLEQIPIFVFPSVDLSRLAFSTSGGADTGPPATRGSNTLYLEGSDPFVEPVWVGGALIEAGSGAGTFVGGTPDLGTLYIGKPGFFEFRNGVLSDAGVLPDGSVSKYGASAPALSAPSDPTGLNPEQTDNQVSADGLRAFFVSTASPAAPAPLELYVRETAADGSQQTVLVSQSQLPGHVGEAAPDGPLEMASAAPSPEHGNGEYKSRGAFGGSYVFASPDGSHAFFASVDRLTEAAPSGPAVKLYGFDLETGVLEYLPGVTGSIVASAWDGSSFVFENTASSPFELDRWVAGPGGGSVTPIVQLPGPARCGALVCLESTRVVGGGSVVVFTTEVPLAGFNDAGGFQQIFRYDASSNELGCVSCPPAGVTPSGDAVMSLADHT